jgi:hypothetical protein
MNGNRLLIIGVINSIVYLKNMSVSRSESKKEPDIDYSVSELRLTSQKSALKYLTKIHEFKNLKTLIMAYCDLPAIPKLPEGLEYLDIHYNSLNYMPPLPTTLKFLDINSNVSSLNIIENLVLPPNLEELCINSNDFINVKLKLPKTLKKIYIHGGDDFTLSKDYLPDGLLDLETYESGNISVHSLPDSITRLKLDGVEFAKTCVLPKSLKDFSVWYCDNKTIPFIPDSVDIFSDGFDFHYGCENRNDITECYQYLMPITSNSDSCRLGAFIYHNWNITKHYHAKFLDEFMTARISILMSPTRIARLLESGSISMDDPNTEFIILST